MRSCSNCDAKWRLKELLALGFSRKGRVCVHCGERQYLSKDTLKLSTLGWLSLLFIPLIIWRMTLSSKEEHLFD